MYPIIPSYYTPHTIQQLAQAEIFRWWRLWERDVRHGWLTISRFRARPPMGSTLSLMPLAR